MLPRWFQAHLSYTIQHRTVVIISPLTNIAGGKRGDYQNCSVLYCIRQKCTIISTLRRAVLTVSLDWVLSHWVYFTVHSLDLVVFICEYFVFFFSYWIYVVLLSAQWGGPNGIEAWSLGLLFFQ